jgi:NitT/TauT family transport system substrate-binding protein
MPLIMPAIVGLLAVGAAAFLLRPQAPHGGPPPGPPPGPPERVRVANIGIFSNYNVLADRVGIFRRNGLDAVVEEYDSGATSMDALAAGDADVAVAASFVGVRRMFDDRDLRILATVSGHDVFRVLARRDRGIEKPADLKGKTIGMTAATAGEFYLGKFLSANGLSRADVTLVDLSASEIARRFTEGELDAAVSFDPNAYRLQLTLPTEVVSWSAQGGRRELATVYARRAFIEEHPEAVARYVRALTEAEAWQASHTDEAKRLLADVLREDAVYVDHLWSQFDFSVRLDQELLVTMEDQARWIIGAGLVEDARVPNYLGYIHFDALERAKPAAVGILHP